MAKEVPWVIVIFVDENRNGIVPVNWFLDEGETLVAWPAFKGQRLQRAIFDKIDKEASWKTVAVRKLSKSLICKYFSWSTFPSVAVDSFRLFEVIHRDLCNFCSMQSTPSRHALNLD